MWVAGRQSAIVRGTQPTGWLWAGEVPAEGVPAEAPPGQTLVVLRQEPREHQLPWFWPTASLADVHQELLYGRLIVREALQPPQSPGLLASGVLEEPAAPAAPASLPLLASQGSQASLPYAVLGSGVPAADGGPIQEPPGAHLIVGQGVPPHAGERQIQAGVPPMPVHQELIQGRLVVPGRAGRHPQPSMVHGGVLEVVAGPPMGRVVVLERHSPGAVRSWLHGTAAASMPQGDQELLSGRLLVSRQTLVPPPAPVLRWGQPADVVQELSFGRLVVRGQDPIPTPSPVLRWGQPADVAPPAVVLRGRVIEMQRKNQGYTNEVIEMRRS